MAKLRKGRCYTKVVRAYTRRSKYKKKGFIKAVPTNKVVKFHMGDLKKKFDKKLIFVSKQAIQIRHNALESSRQIINRNLHTKIGNSNYHFLINVYPHHVLRENKMLSGAHADRLQTGMSHSFGKPTGLAAQLKKGTTVFTVNVNKEYVEIARESLKKAGPRMPGRYGIEII